MAGVAEAYQHLFNDRLPYAFRLTRRVAVCNIEFFSDEMTLFQFNCPSFNDPESRFTIQHSRLANLLLLWKVDLQHN